tara:strand:- start:2063 stop:2848 length:786 start_codon:yes stop_codon:yes gene_type:complete
MNNKLLKKKSSLKVSLITATLNSCDTIDSCLDSIASQTYQNIEHIIIDGLSSDNTLQKIYNHAYKPTKILSKKDQGIYDALNKGINNSTGDIIGFLHSDDYFSNNKVIEKIVKKFEENSFLSAVYGDCEFVSKVDTTKVIRKWKSKAFNSKLILYGWMPPHAALYMRGKIIRSIKGFDNSFKIAGDYNCILRTFTRSDFEAFHIPEVILKMRIGGASNRSFSNIILKTKEDWRALRQNNFGIFSSIRALIIKNISKILQFL